MTANASTASARDLRIQSLLQERLKRTAARTPTIPVRRSDEPAPLAPMQESVWLLQKMSPESTANHRPTAFRLSGPLDRRALQAALDDLVVRHESLRSSVHLIDGQPRQVVQPPSPVILTQHDVRGADEPDTAAFELARAAAREPIDLENGPILRARLIRLAEAEHLLVLQLHHVSMDGWSEGALRADLAAAYAARQRGEAPDLKPLQVQMGDIAAWQRGPVQADAHAESLEYWRRQLEGLPTTLDLPTDRPRTGASLTSDTVTFEIPPDLADRARTLAKDEGTTLYAVLLAAFEVLLSRYARQSDFAIGMPVAGRTHEEMEGVVGCLINLLVLRAHVEGDASFQSHLRHVRTTLLDALQHQAAPLSDVVSVAFPGRQSFEPVYSTMVQLRNFPDVATEGELRVEPVYLSAGESDMDLSLDVVDQGPSHALACRMAYRSDLFDAATVQRVARHYLTLLDAATSDPSQAVGRLPMLTDQERHHLLVELQTPRSAPPDVNAVHVLFERQAARQPDASAVEMGDETWTYGVLNAVANRLAHRMKALGVGPGVPVAIGFGQSIELVMAVIAVHKAGGAYVPLDPDYPVGRVEDILAATEAPLLLTRGASPWPDLPIATLDLDSVDLSGELASNPSVEGYSLDRPAYMLFTSGSTGTPKGVEITQENVLAAYPGWDAMYTMSKRTALLQTARPTFDVFSESWMRTLGAGQRLVLCPRDLLLDPPRYVQAVREHEIDILCGVPAIFRLLTTYLEETGQSLDQVTLAIPGADVWRPDDHARLQAVLPNAEIQNGYGITETTVSNTAFTGVSPVLPSGAVPIGKPYSNSLAYVLDPYGEPVPVGVPGELYIGGPVVGAGYIGRPDLTAERFLPDPFSDTPGARMYRSGDLVRWLPSGDLDFLGRIDFQVKVRGLRIELGEIEAVLMAHPSVAQAVATVQRGTRDDDAIVAHIIPNSDADLDLDALRAHARRQLADYMLPSAFVVCDRFPLSANGKVDRRALEARDVVRAERPTGEPPQTAEEIGLAEIWADVLGVEAIGRRDNFFDLGGHSLRAMQVIARVQTRWGVSIAFRDLVESPSLAELAERIARDETPSEPLDAPQHIIPLGGAGEPVLFVHGIEANTLQFVPLARLLSADYAVYGTQGQGLDGGEISHASVEEMAAAYADEWVGLGVEGAVTLVGLCYGSVLALELARQLEARGAAVGALVSINQAELPSAKGLEPERGLDRLRTGIQTVRSALGAPVRRGLWKAHRHAEANGTSIDRLRRIRYVRKALEFEAIQADRARIERIGQAYERGEDVGSMSEQAQDAIEQYIQLRVQEAYRTRLDAYSGAPFSGRVVLLLSEAHRDESIGHVLGACIPTAEVRFVPGPHAPIREPYVRDLASEIGRIIVDPFAYRADVGCPA